MPDFEVHPIGYAQEIKLSRELAKAIEQELTSYGKVIPKSVYDAYIRLKNHYQKQIEDNIQ